MSITDAEPSPGEPWRPLAWRGGEGDGSIGEGEIGEIATPLSFAHPWRSRDEVACVPCGMLTLARPETSPARSFTYSGGPIGGQGGSRGG